MNPLIEVGLVTSREIRKNLRGVKGIVLLLLSLVGGTLMALILVKAFQNTVADIPKEAVREQLEKAYTRAYNDDAMGKYLAEAPQPLVVMLAFSVWLAPALVWLAGFDTISGEIQYRSIRYWTVRTRRSSYYVGKFLGLWTTVAVITFGMHFFMWIVTIVQGAESAANTLSWGIRFWLVTVPIAASWCGIAVFVGSFFRAPTTSLLVVGFSFFTIFFLGALIPRILPAMHVENEQIGKALSCLYPNTYDAWLLSPRFERAGGGFLICAALAGVPTAFGAFLLGKKDV